MNRKKKHAEGLVVVKIYGQEAAVLGERDGTVYFEYLPEFLKGPLNLSPIVLPFTNGAYTNTDDRFFMGLPGVIADSLPDKFGNAIIEAYFEQKKGTTATNISALQKLLYIGKRGPGALEYEPAEKVSPTREVQDILQIADLVASATQLIKGNISDRIVDILQGSSSAGGARAKVLVQYNQTTREVISGRADYQPGFSDWIIKLDGTGDLEFKNTPGQDYGKLEYVYNHIATDAGLNVPEFQLLEEHGRRHFMTKRFDRVHGEKVHMHSLCGLLHKDFNLPRLVSYETMFSVIQSLCSQEDVIEAYRWMVFNVLGKNHDDHTKNFSFLMNKKGEWHLSPCYDLTYAHGTGWTRFHQMTINNKKEDITSIDLMTIANKFQVKHAREIIERVQAAFTAFRSLAKTHAITPALVDKIYADQQAQIALG